MRRHFDQIISTQNAVKTLGGNLPKQNFNEIFKGVGCSLILDKKCKHEGLTNPVQFREENGMLVTKRIGLPL